MKVAARFLLSLCLSFICPLLAEAQGTKCDIADEAIRSASRIRGLKLLKKVPCTLQDRPQVENYLQGEIDRKVEPNKLLGEEFTYKLLGFLPESFRYREGLVKLYTGQLGGYYDPHKQRYAMAAWLPDIMQPSIAVHELTHALQDQHFHLENFINDDFHSSDELLARSALVEGDATAVMLDYTRELAGEPPISTEPNVSAFLMQNVLGVMVTTGDNPPALVSMMLFPYASGLRYVHQILQQGGYQAVSKAFCNPPRSTREILHPEAKKERFDELPDTPLPGKKPYFSDRLGEFFITLLLSQYVGPQRASAAATGWKNDRLTLYVENGFANLFWRIDWENDAEAQEFVAALRESWGRRFESPLSPGQEFKTKDGTLVAITVAANSVQVALKQAKVVVQ